MRKFYYVLIFLALFSWNVDAAELGAGSGSSYPTAIDTDSTDEVDDPDPAATRARAAVPNDIADAVVKIETELGANPSGSQSSVANRFANIMSELTTNSSSANGIVTAGASYPSKTWSTDASGNPSWSDATLPWDAILAPDANTEIDMLAYTTDFEFSEGTAGWQFTVPSGYNSYNPTNIIAMVDDTTGSDVYGSNAKQYFSIWTLNPFSTVVEEYYRPAFMVDDDTVVIGNILGMGLSPTTAWERDDIFNNTWDNGWQMIRLEYNYFDADTDSDGYLSLALGNITSTGSANWLVICEEYPASGSYASLPAANATHPTIRMLPGTSVASTDYMDIYHDSTNGVIAVGGGSLNVKGGDLLVDTGENFTIGTTQWNSGDSIDGSKIVGCIAIADSAINLTAGVTTFAVSKNYHKVTGDAGANTIATITGGVDGQIVILQFVDALVTITDTDASTVNTINTSAAFTSSANDTMTIIFDGNKWFEVSRSVN